MLRNEKGIRKQLRANQFLLIATILLIIALKVYNNPKIEPQEIEVVEPVAAEYIDELDDRAMELIKTNGFALVKRVQTQNCVSYEVYVNRPLKESLQERTEILCEQMQELWAEYYEDITIRIMILNFGNLEEVDMIMENGIVTFKR